MTATTLRQAREEAGFTQQQMAAKLGVSRPTYVKIEDDPSKATVAQAKAICQLLSRNYERIFFGFDGNLPVLDCETN